jgi:hypothetical protein
MDQVNQTVLATLVLPLANPVLSREMYVSKQLRVPLQLMADAVNGTYQEDAPRFFTYSAHDWTVATMLEFLDAINGNFTVVPFASSIHIELHSTTGCVDVECHWVEVYSNMKPMLFTDVCAIPDKCSYTEFLEILTSRNFVTTSNRYKTECSTPWNPPQLLKQSLEEQQSEIERAAYYYEKYRRN